MGKKQKKEKIRYYDDGRTIADMSNVTGPRLGGGHSAGPRSSAKDKWNTYWNAVKMMFVPMLVVIVILCILYMVAYVVFSLI